MIRHPSPNFGPRRGNVRPSLVVLHYTSMASAEAGWPGGLEDDELVAIAMLVGLGLVFPLALLLLLIEPFLVPAALVGLLFGPGLVSSRLSSMAKERAVWSRPMPPRSVTAPMDGPALR